MRGIIGLSELSLGFIGCGAMGTAIISGIASNKTVSPEKIWVYDLEKERIEYLKREFSVKEASDYADICQNSNYIFLAVKPADLHSLLNEIKSYLNSGHLLISVIAGKTTGFIESALEGQAKVIRLMPNTPCLIGEGVVAISPGSKATAEQLQQVESLVSTLGITIQTEEKKLDAITAVSGSGPGYAYLFMEAMVDGGVNAGLDRNTAEKLVAQTFLGAARMAQSTGKSFGELKNSVTSPGGTTIAAIKHMEKNSLRGIAMDAVEIAAQKAKKLSQEDD